MEDEKAALNCKVVLIGESGVNKTGIICRYITNEFNDKLPSILGEKFTTKTEYFEEEKQSIRFEIWDSAGQEKYRSLTKIFYQNTRVFILVYDITRRDSFDALRNYWIKEIKKDSPKDISKQ